jgi:putative ABC transport system ATP-binding protein
VTRDELLAAGYSGREGLPVRTEALEMTYGAGEAQVRALRGLSLAISGGQFVVVRGRSGSGKTTLFHLIAGLAQPSAGRVLIGDTEMSRLGEADSARYRRRNIGLVYQFFNLVPVLDVVENVALPLMLDGKHLTDSLPRVEALLRRLGIEERATHSVSKLSGGEMQRVAIARALIGDPGLVLADEPTGNLDDRNADEVLDLLTELCRERGITIVMMTHDASATARADRVLTLRDGAIEQDIHVRAPYGANASSH